MRGSAKQFMVTINNPIQPLNSPPLNFESWRTAPIYVIYQYEIGEQGTPHLQCYFCFKHSIRFQTLKNHFPSNPNIQKRLGTHTQAKEYCSKEDTRVQGPWIYGTDEHIAETAGQRTDLAAVKRKLDEGCSFRVIAQEHFSDFIRYEKGFRSYKRLCTPERDWEMEVIVLVGDTGTGKTRFVKDNYTDVYSVPQAKQSGCYWDGYDGQDNVLIDEMYGSRFTHGFLLQLLDRYDFCVPIHGGSVPFVSKRIFLTSNADPSEWYDGVYTKMGKNFFEGPLYRRMTQGNSCIIRCDKSPYRQTILYFK